MTGATTKGIVELPSLKSVDEAVEKLKAILDHGVEALARAAAE